MIIPTIPYSRELVMALKRGPKRKTKSHGGKDKRQAPAKKPAEKQEMRKK